MEVPCKNCELRTETCHDTCKDYRKYHEWREKIRKERMKQKLETPPPHDRGLK